jgi:hypothetical protein
MRRIVVALLLIIGLTLTLVAPAAAAANDTQASCLGVGASGVAPGTKDDVALFITQAAEAAGTNHGQVVSSFAQQKGACIALPPVPPHP